MRSNNISILHNTLDILSKGYYISPSGKRISLRLSREQMLSCTVFLPDEVHSLGVNSAVSSASSPGRMEVSCENIDSFSLARKRAAEAASFLAEGEEKRVLVLNLANPVHPGGGVRKGASAQEEDLCRKSSLLLSLEGEQAAGYYEYNGSLATYMGSDAVIVTPDVEIIRDERGELLEESVVVSVMTCAAPMLRYGMEGMTQAQYEELVFNRITGMLKVAAHLGYRMLVLGAFGCGAFRNDARVISNLFEVALKEFGCGGRTAKELFRRIDFAVLDRSNEQYNFREFARNFGSVDKGEKLSIIGFFHEYEAYGCFSNWYPAEFDYAGKHFLNAEQFMMYHKVMMFGKYDLAEQIMKSKDPYECKKIAGQKFPEFRAEIWEEVCQTVVKRGVKAKFVQNPDLLKKLLGTGEALLAECSPYDRKWGIGIDIKDPDRLDCSKWKGSNYLGRILMEVRDELRAALALSVSGELSYRDAVDLPGIPEWRMRAVELKRIPKYYKVVHAYADSLQSQSQRKVFWKQGTLAELEAEIRSGSSCVLPAAGFFEMKQEIYDIAGLAGIAEETVQKRIEYCDRYIPVLQMICDDPEMTKWCKEYSPIEEERPLVKYLYENLMRDAYKADLVVSDYRELVENSPVKKGLGEFTEEEIGQLSVQDTLGYIGLHFRGDYFNNGTLIRNSVGNGVLLRLLVRYRELAGI